MEKITQSSLHLEHYQFFCDTTGCERRIFTERFATFIEPYARKTARAKASLTMIAFATNAIVSHKLSEQQSLETSASNFLRIIRRTQILVDEDAKFIGIDDWAFRKGNNYGTIVCDHESHRPIALFKGRTTKDVEKWLIDHPGIILATRDRSDSYATALRNVHPAAIQVADRFHLAKNLLDAVKEFARRTLPANFSIIEQTAISQLDDNKGIGTELEKNQPQSLSGREEKRKIVRQVKELRKSNMTIQKIAETTELSKGTVSRYIALSEERASRRRSVKWHGYDKYEGLLIDLVREDKKAIEILKILREKGVIAGKSTLFRWVHDLKNKGASSKDTYKPQQNEKWIKRYDMTSYLWSCKEDLKKEEEQALENIFANFPLTYKLYGIIQNFREILKDKKNQELKSWIDRAMLSGISEIITFAKGLQKDFQEVHNALIYPHSNGLVEGHVNRLKMIKRMMFGRAKLDLLRQRVLYRL